MKKTTTEGYSDPTYQIPAFIVSLAPIPSTILVCLVISYLVIKCKKFIKKLRLGRKQSRIVRDSGTYEMCSVINEQYMPSPER